MNTAKGRRPYHLSYQNKTTDVRLEERSAALERHVVTRRTTYDHERRQSTQALKDFDWEKKRVHPRPILPSPPAPTTKSCITDVGSGDRVRRKLSIPSKLSSHASELELVRKSIPTGKVFIRRSRAKSKSLVDLPNELSKADNYREYSASFECLPSDKDRAEFMSATENMKKSHRTIHYTRCNSSPADSLPPISRRQKESSSRNWRIISNKGKAASFEVLPPKMSAVRFLEGGQRRQIKPLKQSSVDEIEKFNQHVELKTASRQCSNSTDLCDGGIDDTYELAEHITADVFPQTQKAAGDFPLRRATILEDRLAEAHKNLENDGNQRSDLSEPKENQTIPAKHLHVPERELVKGVGRTHGNLLPGKKRVLFLPQDAKASPATLGTTKQEGYPESMLLTNSSQVVKNTISKRKASIGSQQAHVLQGQVPCEDVTQNAVRKVSTESNPPLINLSAALHGKTRRAGSGMTPNMSNLFLDAHQAYQSGNSLGSSGTVGGIKVDMDPAAGSNFNPARRPSFGVPTNAAERSRERGSLALRGNRVRQGNNSTAEMFQYYQNVPEAAALAGISVEPIDLSELESCRYLRKYVPKSLRDETARQADS